jgi:hypothetical protein
MGIVTATITADDIGGLNRADRTQSLGPDRLHVKQRSQALSRHEGTNPSRLTPGGLVFVG